MDGGDYNEDTSRNSRRTDRNGPTELQAVVPLPRERLCAQVVAEAVVRPPIREGKKKKRN